MVRQWQQLFYGGRYSHSILKGDPDFVKLAESYGCLGMRVTKKEEVRSSLEKAIAVDNTVLIDFKVEPEENVFPMVPAGQAINQFIGGLA